MSVKTSQSFVPQFSARGINPYNHAARPSGSPVFGQSAMAPAIGFSSEKASAKAPGDSLVRFGTECTYQSSTPILERDIPVLRKHSDVRGKYPESLRGIMAGVPVVVVGAGDLYRGKIEQALKHLGADVTLVDRDPSRIRPGEKSMPNLDKVPDKAMVLVLTPNKSHETVVNEVLEKHHVRGVYVEKPPVISTDQMGRLREELEQHDTPAYLGDHYLFHALPLFSLMGVKSPYRPYVQITQDTPDKKLAKALNSGKPLLKNVVDIDGALLQSGGAQGSLVGREWLHDRKMGGGMMLDLMIHLLNTVDVAGFAVESLDQVKLDTHPEKTQDGAYRPIPKGDEDTAEDHALISGKAHNGADIRLEVGKYAAETKRNLILTDRDGYQLRVDFGSPDTIEYYGPEKHGKRELLGKAQMEVDPYLLVMDHAMNSLQHPDWPVLFAPEQIRSLDTIERAQAMAREGKPFNPRSAHKLLRLPDLQARRGTCGESPRPPLSLVG